MAAAQFQLDEKWKLCKKGSVRNGMVGCSLLRSASSSSSSSSASSSVKRSSFTRRCARLVKEQRARFYIMRRCVTMLVCWREYSDA
ncbi:unnamed protein product [Victoria cruziana]